MQIGGTLVTAIVRIAVLAATLALVYVFILKPVLNTTENVTKGVNANISSAMEEVNRAFDGSNTTNRKFSQVQIKRSITTTSGRKQQRLLRCVQNSNQDIARIQRCAARFGP
ncbi:MAG TPA: hypothetical protein VMF31_02125 [Solirubrobacterales bacterium]|nr:hypothetical protein [Solirubrobacterales bacterium]